MTVVLLFFFLGFCLCSPLTMCLFRLKAELNVLEHSFHKYLSDTLTLFSLTKMPKPTADFTFLTWFSCEGFSRVFSHVYLSKLWFEFCSTFFMIPRLVHLVRLFFVHLLVVSDDMWLVCILYVHFSHLCFLSRFLTAGLNIVAQIQVWNYFRIGLNLV